MLLIMMTSAIMSITMVVLTATMLATASDSEAKYDTLNCHSQGQQFVTFHPEPLTSRKPEFTGEGPRT